MSIVAVTKVHASRPWKDLVMINSFYGYMLSYADKHFCNIFWYSIDFSLSGNGHLVQKWSTETQTMSVVLKVDEMG
jgi:hypothetical protein